MNKHFYILQASLYERNVNTLVINKLYKLIQQQNKTNDAYSNDTDFRGEIYTGITYQEYIDDINEQFPYLTIHPQDICIMFADKNVENILMSYYSSNGVGITKSLEVDTNNGFYVNNIQIFQGNTSIETFNELNQLENVKTLGYTSFYNCTNLKSIDLTNIVTLNNSAFSQCSSLSMAVNMPKLQNLNGDSHFYKTKITSIRSLGNITTLPMAMFADNSSLIQIENNALQNISIIEDGVFSFCVNLTDLGNLRNLTRIKNWSSFSGCESLTSIDWDQSKIVELGINSFSGCKKLVINDLNMPNLTNNVLQSTFVNTKLKQISNIGTYVKKLKETFKNCYELTQINNNALQYIETIDENTFLNCSSLISIGDISNVKMIKNNAFYGCTLLTNITLPEGLTFIGSEVFRNCKALTSIVLPSSLTSLGGYVFEECTNLQSANIPQSINTLASNLFRRCTSLTSITIDWSKITQMSSGVFEGCTLLGEGETIDINLPEQTNYPNGAFGYTRYKKLIIHMQLGEWNGIIGNYDSRYPIYEGMYKLEYLDLSDTNFYSMACLYLQNFEDDGVTRAGNMKTIIWPSTIIGVDWRWNMYQPRLENLILLIEDPSQMSITGSGTNYLKGNGNENDIPLTCNIYVKDATVRAAYLAHEFWGTIPNASTRIKTLAELPTGIWTTGLYQQYEPYLSNH